MPRIVSLIASATEIVCALGFEDHLVGRSHECDFPDTVHRLPICTSPKFDIHGTSREIDERVKETLRNSISVYNVHTDVLNELRPDVIVTQSQCDVCAVSLRDVERSLDDLVTSSPRLVSLAPNRLTDVWQDIQRVADALGAFDRGRDLIARLRARMDGIVQTTVQATEKPTVACLEWLDPLMAAGNWMPELVTMAGGINLFGTAGTHSPAFSWEELVRNNPEVIVAMPCGWDIARTRKETAVLTERPEWRTLRAVANRRVYLTDGNQFFNRPGPRLVESLEILAELFHPELVAFGHQGSAWERL